MLECQVEQRPTVAAEVGTKRTGVEGNHTRENVKHRLRLVVHHDVLVRRHPAAWECVAPWQVFDGPVKAERGPIGSDDVIAGKVKFRAGDGAACLGCCVFVG